ncbi:MAG TPA: serine/threonine-protein kinase, partial [Myxococcota bacterium]|nr:serine/threonine-protein kinase [Myxococcota bacterium]
MLDVGSPIDRYTVERHLGSGASAEVYLVRHKALGSRYALKLTHHTSRVALARTLQEGRIQARLRHPNVVPVYDVLDMDGRCALVLEFVAGPPLDRVLRAGPLTIEQIDALARGIMAGVAVAHQQGLVHRDLKPANVLVECAEEQVVPRISDFGIARAPDSQTSTRTGVAMGTPDYMPPEQIRSAARADARSDVFSLGAMLYEMLSGAPPIASDDLVDRYQKLCDRGWRPLAERAPRAPARMIRAVEAALQPDP